MPQYDNYRSGEFDAPLLAKAARQRRGSLPYRIVVMFAGLAAAATCVGAEWKLDFTSSRPPVHWWSPAKQDNTCSLAYVTNAAMGRQALEAYWDGKGTWMHVYQQPLATPLAPFERMLVRVRLSSDEALPDVRDCRVRIQDADMETFYIGDPLQQRRVWRTRGERELSFMLDEASLARAHVVRHGTNLNKRIDFPLKSFGLSFSFQEGAPHKPFCPAKGQTKGSSHRLTFFHLFSRTPLRTIRQSAKLPTEPLDGLLTTREPLAMRSGAGRNPGSSIFKGELMHKRTIVYIDSFNLYYGLLRVDATYKWLDLWKFAAALVTPRNDIVAVKYFTSRVNYDPKKPSSKERQEIYLRALQKMGVVEIVEGFYQRRDSRMPFRFEPCKSCRPFADVVRIEEKRSDVNLATAMMVDFHEDRADSFVIISGDADLIAPIDYIRRIGRRNVVVLNPHAAISGDLKKHATFYKNIPRDLPGRCRLPDEIVYGSHNRVIRCPDAWRVSSS